jgi:protein deglycase
LANGCEEVEALTPIDVLRRAGIDVLVAGIDSRDIAGNHSIRINADLTVDELPLDLDGVIIPGGMPGAAHVAGSDESMRVIRSMLEAGKLVGAICAAPAVVLGKAGLLAGKKFTCFPGWEKEVTDGVFLEDRVVRDGNLITSRAVGTAFEFSLAVVEYLSGRGVADTVADRCLALRAQA